VSELMKVSDPVYSKAVDLSEEYDTTLKEAVSRMCREGGFDV